ncbi:MAG: glycosyltransferase family 1 protein [Acidobacteria bacterium]|nr:MAG: glycosyltransferase family 1 protein [Acidobacteriota bacterium]
MARGARTARGRSGGSQPGWSERVRRRRPALPPRDACRRTPAHARGGPGAARRADARPTGPAGRGQIPRTARRVGPAAAPRWFARRQGVVLPSLREPARVCPAIAVVPRQPRSPAGHHTVMLKNVPEGAAGIGASADRVTVAYTYGFPLTAGGVEAHVLSLVDHGDSSRFRWLVIGDAGEEFRRLASRRGVPIVPWRGPRWPGDIAAAARLLGIVRRNRVGLLHAHSPRGLVQAAVAGRLARIPVVATVHLPVQFLIRGHGATARFKLAAYRLLDRALVRRLVPRTIFVASSVCRESVSRGLVLAERARVVRNGVELARFRGPHDRGEARRALGIPEAAVVACFVGRLETQKGIDTLVEAFATLPVEALDLYLLVAGDGSLRSGLEEAVRGGGRNDRVRFLSFRKDVEKVLGASDIFVLPSRFEAMPIALIEAMAAGLPSVVTDVGDNAEIVGDAGLGLVVPPGDVGALARGIDALARAAETRRDMGVRAREAARRYSAEVAAHDVERVYAEVLGKGGDGSARLP